MSIESPSAVAKIDTVYAYQCHLLRELEDRILSLTKGFANGKLDALTKSIVSGKIDTLSQLTLELRQCMLKDHK